MVLLEIDIPKGCGECPLLYDKDGKYICPCLRSEITEYKSLEKRRPDCPMMDLADFKLDAKMNDQKDFVDEDCRYYDKKNRMCKVGRTCNPNDTRCKSFY